MKNKQSLNAFSTGTLMALGLGINSLCSDVIAEDNPFKLNNKQIEKPKVDTNKNAEMLCGSHMQMDREGMVMFENKDRIPKDCKEISEEVSISVSAGTEYSANFPGTVFGYSEHQWFAKPCARITVEFNNNDDIRHQWMVHGLPKYLYPEGMFHMEINGQGKKTGTFIVPSSHYTYLVHCDIAQHMEKGMKGQLKVGKGRGDLASIPGLTDPTFPDIYNNSK